jgi:hypothetical protein
LFANQIQPLEEAEDQASDFWSNSKCTLGETWKSHLATVLSNQVRGWKRIVTALGDQLQSTGNTCAAHFCYLVCGRPITLHSDPASRLVFIGSDHKSQLNISLLTRESWESILRTEAFEWAKRKGNPNAVITALQPFKLQYAMLLADYGFELAAKKYVDSVRKCTGLLASSSCKRTQINSKKMYPKDFEEDLEIFEDRLSVSLGLQSVTVESNEKFGLGAVLSKIISKPDKVEERFHDPIHIDASFDENEGNNEDANMTFVSASSNILDITTATASTLRSAHQLNIQSSSMLKIPNSAIMSKVNESEELSDQTVHHDQQGISIDRSEETRTREIGSIVANLETENSVQALHSQPFYSVGKNTNKQQATKQVVEEAPRSNPINITKSAASTPIDRKPKKDAPSSGSSE